MKNKFAILSLLGLLLAGMLANSCKKDAQATVESLLSRGTWQLASITVDNYVGSSKISTDTLNTLCLFNQSFTFNTDFSCNYKYFACFDQNVNGTWKLSDDKLTLQSNITCKDTLNKVTITSKPFANARILNLGQYSLVMETGDLSSYYLSTDKRHIKRYGFIRY
jgi:hypothetical protein